MRGLHTGFLGIFYLLNVSSIFLFMDNEDKDFKSDDESLLTDIDIYIHVF